MRIFIDLFYLLAFAFYLPLVIFRRKWYGEILQRLALYPADVLRRIAERPVIWVHAVSVGEVIAVSDLVKELARRYPDRQIVFSTVTVTGYEVARSDLGEAIDVIMAPADFSFIVRRAIRLIRPKIYIAAETELWPNLYYALGRARVPIVLVNGRISDKSFKAYLRLRFFFRSVLKSVQVFAMQTAEDARRIVALGAPDNRVQVVGNLKFQSIEKYRPTVSFDHLGAHPVLLGGSTHPGEDALLLNCLSALRERDAEMRLIIAPRHIERADEVMREVSARGFKAQRISSIVPPWNRDTVIVVDQIGLLRSLYTIATLVFVGKSFEVGGGQNMIEPVALGKPTFVGPLTQNFKDVVALFLREQVLFQVDRREHLAVEMMRVLDNTNLRKHVADCGAQVIQKYHGAKERTLEIINQIVSAHSPPPRAR